MQQPDSSQSWSYTLCGRNGTCCPVVRRVDANEFTITDDFGGQVKLTLEQLQLMQNVLDQLKPTL